MKIAYKILIPVLVIATLALLVFAPILHVKLEGTALDMIGLSVPEYNSVYGTVQEIEQMDASRKETLKNLFDTLFNGEETETSQKIKEQFKEPVAWAAAAGVLLALTLLLLIAVVVFGVATKKYGITFLLSFLALAAGFGADKCFGKAASLLMKMNLTSLLGSVLGGVGDLLSGLGNALGGMLSGLVNNAFSITVLSTAYGYQFALLVLLALTVFTGGWFLKHRLDA